MIRVGEIHALFETHRTRNTGGRGRGHRKLKTNVVCNFRCSPRVACLASLVHAHTRARVSCSLVCLAEVRDCSQSTNSFALMKTNSCDSAIHSWHYTLLHLAMWYSVSFVKWGREPLTIWNQTLQLLSRRNIALVECDFASTFCERQKSRKKTRAIARLFLALPSRRLSSEFRACAVILPFLLFLVEIGDLSQFISIREKSYCKVSLYFRFFFFVAPSYVRLRNGNFSSGSVEIYHQGTWGRVCSEGWSRETALVACRELGFEKVVIGGTLGTVIESGK